MFENKVIPPSAVANSVAHALFLFSHLLWVVGALLLQNLGLLVLDRLVNLGSLGWLVAVRLGLLNLLVISSLEFLWDLGSTYWEGWVDVALAVLKGLAVILISLSFGSKLVGN